MSAADDTAPSDAAPAPDTLSRDDVVHVAAWPGWS